MSIIDEVSAARKKIYRDGYDISFGELASLYAKNELIIQPEYQRLFRWDETQKTRFIESLILNIPIPPIFVFSDDKGRWELVDGLQRVSTVMEYMGLLKDENGAAKHMFQCDGTTLIPSLKDRRWTTPQEEELDDEQLPVEVLPLPLRLSVRRARIRVEILGQETDAHTKYELFQRLNSGGTKLTEQEIRNCIILSISKNAFENIKAMSQDENFIQMCAVGEDRQNRQYLIELVVRFLVLRHFEYRNGLDVHEYLDNGIIKISEDSNFEWARESELFALTMKSAMQSAGADSFKKNNRFSLGMYEFITLGLSKRLEANPGATDIQQLSRLIGAVSTTPEAMRYSGVGIRGTQRLANFVVPGAEIYFRA